MANTIAGNDQLACQIMRELGERALDEKFSDLVKLGMELRNNMTADSMLVRQQEFMQRPERKA
jgi:hypothetical protein